MVARHGWAGVDKRCVTARCLSSHLRLQGRKGPSITLPKEVVGRLLILKRQQGQVNARLARGVALHHTQGAHVVQEGPQEATELRSEGQDKRGSVLL